MQQSSVAQIYPYITLWDRLAVATADFGLHLLSKSASGSEDIFPFGGGLRWVVMICCNRLRLRNRFRSVVITEK